MKKIIIVSLLPLLFFTSANAQRGVQIGVGMGTMLMTYNEDRPRSVSPLSPDLQFATITGQNARYIELKLDYAFSPKWQLRSGVQYRSRTISYRENQSLNRRTDMLTIPFMLRYQIPLQKSDRLNLGLSAGLTLDRYFDTDITTISTGTINNSMELISINDDFYNGGILSLNGSWRFGVDMEKDLGEWGRIGLQIMYSFAHLGNVVDSYSDVKLKVYDPSDSHVLLSEKSETLIYDGRQSGYQIGINYYFGSLHWNKK